MDYAEQKQTAVEWLLDQLECFGNKHELTVSWTTVDELVEQAKEMEKQQIMESYKDSTCQFSVDSRIDCPKSAEQYFNETFNK